MGATPGEAYFALRRLSRAACLGAIAMMVCAGSGAAKMAWPNSCESIQQSQLIVYGRVISVWDGTLDIGGAQPAPARIAQVRIAQRIKGEYAGDSILVVASQMSMEDRVWLEPAANYVLMLTPYQTPGGKPRQDLYVPSHHGYGNSIASPDLPVATHPHYPAPLRFYYDRNAAGAGVIRDFHTVQEYIQEIRRIMAAWLPPQTAPARCE